MEDGLHSLLEDNGIKMVKYLQARLEARNGDGYQAKELCVWFTLNNVACCRFDLEENCFQKENSDFRKLPKELGDSD